MRRTYLYVLLLWLGTGIACRPTKEYHFLISGYGCADSACIGFYTWNSQNAEVTPIALISGVDNPSFLTATSSQDTALVVSEMGENNSSLCWVDLKKKHVIQSQAVGYGPCHVALDKTEQWAIVSNYGDGTIDIVPLQQGQLSSQRIAFTGSGPIAKRQDHSRCHSATFTPDLQSVLICDLGADCIHVCTFESDTLCHEYDVVLSPGSGPRHICLRSSGTMGYLINEIAGTVCVLRIQDNKWQVVQEVICDSVGAHGSAAICLSEDERFVYASNRLQADGISIYRVEESTGLLTRIGYQPTGTHPRAMTLSPDGKWLLCACRDDNAVEIYKRNPRTGFLQRSSKSISFSKPVCICFVP